MENIDSILNNIQYSKTATDEKQKIEKVWKYISKNRISIQVFSISKDGKKTDINNISRDSINNIQIIFSKGDISKVFNWKPLDKENIFILFRE